MGCKHPLIRATSSEKWKTAKDGHAYKQTFILRPNDIERGLEEYRMTHPNWTYEIIPCKKCIGCRLDYSREWANRGYLEAQHWEQNYFVTLTYNDENLPKNESLVPEHLTLFIKRLRQYMRKNNIQRDGIRFMAAGEYGEERKRPHYHIILFNCNLPLDSFYAAKIHNKNTYWQNKIIEKLWKYGFSTVSSVTWNNIAYTARYITKKINGAQAFEEYAVDKETGEALDRIPEFFRTSRNPGIGGYYYEENKNIIYENDEIITKNRKGVIASKPPKYFDRLLEKENPEAIKTIKRERRKRQRDNIKAKMTQTSATELEQLAIEERSLVNKTMKLLRDMERTN